MTDASGFCRDCLQPVPATAQRCPGCRGPRIARHVELESLAIAHVDCDAFYAAIEKRDDPSLTDRPVIVGGGRRGVVSTACYIARVSGVRSAMPMFKALKLCPDAVVIRPDMQKYVAVGRQVRAMMLELTPLVEPVSIDEAFLDLSGTERTHRASPALTLARFALRVEREIGISVSVGLSHNKFLAKVASDLDKPRGFSVIGRAETLGFLASRPVGLIFGIGAAMQQRLAREGIRTIGDLQRRETADLVRAYGNQGIRLAKLARGEDDRRVSPERQTKSVSSETTFEHDMSDAEELARILWRLTESVSRRLKKAGLAGRTVTVKLKTADFRTITRSHTLDRPTDLADRIFDAGRRLLARVADGTRFRLVGIGVSDFAEPDDAGFADLIDPRPARREAAERAVDRIREKFGNAAVERGLGFGGPVRRRRDRPLR